MLLGKLVGLVVHALEWQLCHGFESHLSNMPVDVQYTQGTLMLERPSKPPFTYLCKGTTKYIHVGIQFFYFL